MAKSGTSFSKEKPSTGRPKGSKNRTTNEMLLMVKDLVDSNLDKLVDDIKNLQPMNRVIAVEKLMKYVLPTLTVNKNDNQNSGGMTIKIIYDDDEVENKPSDKELLL